MTGEYKPGEKLPGEQGLATEFGTSRITIGRAVRELQQKGLVFRRAGSGTFVGQNRSAKTFGLLIPDLGETEVFEPICHGIATSTRMSGCALLWGNNVPNEDAGEQALQLCQGWIERGVSGVFFAPLESPRKHAHANRRIVSELTSARIPVVLLDRDLQPPPFRSECDLVSLDNRHAGFRAAEHLISLGRKRLSFVSRPDSASSVAMRRMGYLDAKRLRGISDHARMDAEFEPDERKPVLAHLKQAKPDAIVCANDRTAAQLMQTMIRAGVRIPEDVALVGVDDLSYAGLLPVPLTTIRQPCQSIGRSALALMMERLEEPELPAREVLLQGRLVVRRSCGSELSR